MVSRDWDEVILSVCIRGPSMFRSQAGLESIIFVVGVKETIKTIVENYSGT
jgi:hypothetical protein